MKIIEKSGHFDEAYYLFTYPDVREKDVDPIKHYIEFGAKEERNPSGEFNTRYYLENNPDIKEINPLLHYIVHGEKEGRRPKFVHKRQEYSCSIEETRLGSVFENNRNSIYDSLSETSIGLYRENALRVSEYFRTKNKKNKIVVYTALIGEYDVLKIPVKLDPLIDYVCFSDRSYSAYNPWIVKAPVFEHSDPTMVARFHKLNPHLLFPEYETSIWVDATLLIRKECDLQGFAKQFLESGRVLATVDHPRRSCVYEEAEACLRYKKDDIEKIKTQVREYRELGLESGAGLAETMLVITSPNRLETKLFFEQWWAELLKHSKRDQLSLPYVLYKNKISYHSLMEDGYDYRADEKSFKYYVHAGDKNPLYPDQYAYPKFPLDFEVSWANKESNKTGSKNIRIGLILGELSDKGDFTGTSYIRVLLPMVNLKKQYPNVSFNILTSDIVENSSKEYIKQFDAFFTLRNYLSHKSLSILVDSNAPIIYDLDDNLFVEAPNFGLSANQKSLLANLLNSAALCICSTRPLANLLKEKTQAKIVLRENKHDPLLWGKNITDKSSLKDSVDILFMGTRSHDDDLEIVRDAALKIKKTFKNVNFHIIGGVKNKIDWMDPYPLQSNNYVDFVLNFKKAAFAFDFAICPLGDTAFNSYKSSIKYLDYSAVGMPAIFSNCAVYEDVVRDGENGILLNNDTNSWYEAIKKLVLSPDLRYKLAYTSNKHYQDSKLISEVDNKILYEQIFSVLRSDKVDTPKRPGFKSDHNAVLDDLSYRSYQDLFFDISKNIHKLDHDYDLVVGVPRSGMIPAYYVGMLLNISVISLDELINQVRQSRGDRKLKDLSQSELRILLIDDSVNLGNAYSRVSAALPESYLGRKCTYDFFAVYGSQNLVEEVRSLVFLPVPRIFQWNYRNHGIAQHACYDIDGVLCVDPSDEENDDGERYIDFVLNAKPLYIPNYKIKALVTSRLEKYRKETEAWLQKNNVIYDKLYMLDLPSKEERVKNKAHGKFKAQVYKDCTEAVLFIESNSKQAKEIFELTGKPVICTENDIYYSRSVADSKS